jgi:hypothetical protein
MADRKLDKLPAAHLRDALELSKVIFSSSNDFMERALTESENYVHSRQEYRLRHKKLNLTSKAIREFIQGIFGTNVENQILDIEKELRELQIQEEKRTGKVSSPDLLLMAKRKTTF